MNSVTFAIDESGAKGFSDNREKQVGEFGVFAGFLVPDKNVSNIELDLDRITKPYLSKGKFHITDLDNKDQEPLRKEVFDYLLMRRVIWAYEAMYVEGFYDYHQMVTNLKENAKAGNRSKIKTSSNKKLDLLHSDLFLGLFGKGVAFCLEHVSDQFHLNVITDRVDKPILKQFHENAKRLLNAGKRSTQESTGFNPETKQVVKASISTEVTKGKDLLGDYSGVVFDIKIVESSLTLAADILANSVYHHLLSLQENSSGHPLNSLEAIKDHKLASIVYGVSMSEAGSNQIADTIFRHPNKS